MNKDDPRWSDARVTASSSNVFIDLGFDTAEPEIMALRAEVMIHIEQRLKSNGWTQLEAAKHLTSSVQTYLRRVERFQP